MFCSIECCEKSFKRYHSYECPIMDQLLVSGNVHMALRLLFIGLSAFNGKVEDLKAFIKENETPSLTVFDLGNPEDFQDDRKLLLTLFSFTRSSNIYSLKTHESILRSHTKLCDIWTDHQEFVEAFLHRQCQTSDLNFHGIFSASLKDETGLDLATTYASLQQPVGSASMLFASLINHSCANNVVRTCVEGKIVITVCRPIARGAQLFDCYK